MKSPQILQIESVAIFHSSQVSYALITKLSDGWVAYLDGMAAGFNNDKFNIDVPPMHLFDAHNLGDSIYDVDETIREELKELIQVCTEAGCRYFQVLFDDFEIIDDDGVESLKTRKL